MNSLHRSTRILYQSAKRLRMRKSGKAVGLHNVPARPIEQPAKKGGCAQSQLDARVIIFQKKTRRCWQSYSVSTMSWRKNTKYRQLCDSTVTKLEPVVLWPWTSLGLSHAMLMLRFTLGPPTTSFLPRAGPCLWASCNCLQGREHIF